MFKKIIDVLKKVLDTIHTYRLMLVGADSAMHGNMEAYIVAGNPQNSCDVDHLEREYYRKQTLHLNY
jgi:hypothetical protein